MDTATVLAIVNIIVSALSPVISAFAIAIVFFVSHVKVSKCCGGEIDMDDSGPTPVLPITIPSTPMSVSSNPSSTSLDHRY